MKQIVSLLQTPASVLDMGRTVFLVIVTLLTGWLAAKLVWMVLEPQGAVAHALPIPVISQSTGNTTLPAFTTDVTVLVQQSKFGSGGAPVDIIPDAPETSLNLRLKGLRATASGDENASDQAMAIILTPDNTSKIYHIGDTIIEGVTLEQIYADRAIINRRGERETLMMDSSAGALSVLSRPDEEGMIEGTPRTASSPETRRGQSTPIFDRNLAASLRFDTIVEDGNLIGYELDTSANPGAFSQLGLETNDLLVGLNGDRIGDIEIQDVLNRLSGAGNLTLTLERDGQSQTLSFRLPEGN